MQVNLQPSRNGRKVFLQPLKSAGERNIVLTTVEVRETEERDMACWDGSSL